MWDSFNFDDTGISLLVFLSRTNLKADDNYVTCKKVKKFIIVLDFLKAFIRYFILLAALVRSQCFRILGRGFWTEWRSKSPFSC